jgi:protein-S-isoprenylcysteine O-methyltransferase Ste14
MAGYYFLTLTITATLLLLGSGGALLYDSVSHNLPSELPEVIGGALLFALGLILLYSQARLAVRWIHVIRTESPRNP